LKGGKRISKVVEKKVEGMSNQAATRLRLLKESWKKGMGGKKYIRRK